jgi:hypothetical protein
MVVRTNPIGGGPGGVRRPILRNKANSASRPRVPRAKCAISPRCPLRETKPNLGEPGYLRDGTRDAGQMRQTNPIWTCREESVGQALPYEWGQVRQTNPIFRPASGEDDRQQPALSAANGPQALAMPAVTRAIVRQRLVARCRSGNKANFRPGGPPGLDEFCCRKDGDLVQGVVTGRVFCPARSQRRSTTYPGVKVGGRAAPQAPNAIEVKPRWRTGPCRPRRSSRPCS